MVCKRCLPLTRQDDIGELFFLPQPVLARHPKPELCESCHFLSAIITTNVGGVAFSHPAELLPCHECNRWLCTRCRLAQTLGRCVVCPAMQSRTGGHTGISLKIPHSCLSQAEVDELSRLADAATAARDSGKLSTGTYGSESRVLGGRSRRVAQIASTLRKAAVAGAVESVEALLVSSESESYEESESDSASDT